MSQRFGRGPEIRARAAVAGWLALLSAPLALAKTPDFSGVWERDPPLHDPTRAGEELFTLEPPLPGGEPQLKQPYLKDYRELLERKRLAEQRGEPIADASVQCLPNGMPEMMMGILPIEILQTPKQLVIVAEELSQIRRLHLNATMPANDDIVPGYNGYSVGRWEGSTLVVETRGVREDVRFLDIPHSSAMKVIERLRLIAPDLLEEHIVIEDPAALAKPYTFTWRYKKNQTYQLAEYVCDNNHYSVDSDGSVSFDRKPEQ